MHQQSNLRHIATIVRDDKRRGAIIVLSAIMMVVVMAFVAFTVDVGFILVTKAQMESAVDAATLAASQDLKDGLKPGYTTASLATAEAAARQSAQTLAGLHQSGDRASIYVNSTSGVRFGQAQWNATTKTWTKVWGVSPYNLVEVTANRSGSAGSSAADGPLNLFFAPVLGHKTASLVVKSTSVVPVGVGIRRPPHGGGGGSGGGCNNPAPEPVDVLPIAVDEPTWNALMAGVGTDQFTYSANCGGTGGASSGGVVTGGADGVKEINIYPLGSASLPSGNRGTVDIGAAGNSTADLKRQITDGLSDSDLAYFPNSELRCDNGPLSLNGDTGLSAGIESSLQSIIGKPRLIPIFRSVAGNGNNAQYEIVKFVGVRLLEVKLTGAPAQKRVIAQPCNFSSSAVIRGAGVITPDSYFAMPAIIN